MKRVNSILLTLSLVLLGSAFAWADTARLQVIHNAADPAAAEVDIYVNGDLLLDDFAFRTATPFVDVPSGVTLNVGVAPGTSASVDDTLANFQLVLEENQTYVAIANGVLNPGGFAANPEGNSIAFSVFPRDDIRTGSRWPWLVKLIAFHGATDAPTVDIMVEASWGNWVFLNDLTYGEFSSYKYLVPKSYTLNVTPGGDNNTVVASFGADLSGLGGGAAVVFASGFLNPSANQDGAPFGLLAALPNGTVVEFPRLDAEEGMARLQVIHNAADPAAEMVDVYVNGDLLLDDFAFRAATPFVDVPAGVELNIGIAPATSASVNDTIANFPVTLAANETYVAVANGVLDPSSFAANPEARAIDFSIFARPNARESARFGFIVDVLAFHGATDAPAVDIIAQGKWLRWKLINDLAYGEFSSYEYMFAKKYELSVTPAGDNNTVVAKFAADLRGLEGSSAVVFASGFLTPSANQDGPGFGLFAALADGTVVEFPMIVEEQFARLQIIHNAADPAAAEVDVWVNGNRLLDDFAFRTATPFVDVPAGVDLNIGVAPGGSASQDDALASFTVNLMADKKYIAFANGVLDPSGFEANPDGRSIDFTLFTKPDAREAGMYASKVDFFALHGATDAPTVDVIARGVGTLVDDAAYGDLTEYLSVPATDYILDITPGNDNSTIVASYDVNLSGLGGGAAAVFASGFLTPGNDQGGPAFGLFAALPNGTVVEFPVSEEPTMARLQVIHNAADPAAEEVDIWVNGGMLLDNFAFRTATPFVDVPANTDLEIGVAPAGSGSQGDALASFTVNLMPGVSYVAIANGVLDPSGFEANPDGRSTAFTLLTKAPAREAGQSGSGSIDFFALHGATDAPTVDIIARGVATLVDDAAYGDLTDYITVPTGNYVLDVTPGGDNATIVASFRANLAGLGGGSAVVFASGFLSPSNDQDGEEFGLFAALPNGEVVKFPEMKSRMLAKGEGSLPQAYSLAQNYPNPFNPTTTISFALPEAARVNLTVLNVLGQEVRTLVDEKMEAGEHLVEFDASRLSTGVYFYRIETDSFTDTRKMLLVK